MRANSYVIVFPSPHADPEIGIIQKRISPNSFIVTVGEETLSVSRSQIERMKPRQRRNYRKSQRGH